MTNTVSVQTAIAATDCATCAEIAFANFMEANRINYTIEEFDAGCDDYDPDAPVWYCLERLETGGQTEGYCATIDAAMEAALADVADWDDFGADHALAV